MVMLGLLPKFLLLLLLRCVVVAAFFQQSAIVEINAQIGTPDFAALVREYDGTSNITQESHLHSALFHGVSITIASHSRPSSVQAIWDHIRLHPAVLNTWITRKATPLGSSKRNDNSDGDVASDRTLWGRAANEPHDADVDHIFPPHDGEVDHIFPPHDGDVDHIFPPHREVGIDKLHAQGIKGKGIKIAILDTSFDYKQEPFGFEIGPGRKIVYGYDWTADREDPFADCSHHGTHVLGIIAANATKYGVVGAAPESTIELHRIFDCDNVNDETTMFAALTAAWERGADIINCSWGFSDPYESALSVLAQRIMRNGTYVQFTAGNSGPTPFTLSTPGATHDIPAVASVDCTMSAAYFWNGTVTADASVDQIRWVPGRTNHTLSEFPAALSVWAPFESINGTLPWHPGPFPATLSLPDIEKTVLLVRLDHYSAHRKQIVDFWKPRYILMYHPMANDLGFPGMYFPSWPLSELPDTRALATVEYSTAVSMVRRISRGESVSVTLATGAHHAEEVLYATNHRTGGRITEFSSWGPTVYGEAGVTFAAPGGRILSTLPSLYGGFGQLSGTSMAAPLVASVAALMKQVHPEWHPDMIRNVLATTARPLPYTDNSTRSYGFLAPVIQQGGGLIDAYAAVHTTTMINVSSLEFLDLAHKPNSLSFSVTNIGSNMTNFDLNHIGAASGYAKGSGFNFVDDKYLEQSQMLMAEYATVEIIPKHIVLSPGHTATVLVSVTPPTTFDATRIPFYGGYIALNSTDGGQNLTVPYSGIAARLPHDLPLVRPDGVASAIYHTANSSASTWIPGTTFSFDNIGGKTFSPSGIWPAIALSRPILQMRRSRVSIISVNTGSAVLVHNLTHEDWNAHHYFWNATDAESSPLQGPYYWKLQYEGLSPSSHMQEADDEDEMFEILTQPFTIRYGEIENFTYEEHEELRKIDCDIEPAEGFK